MKFIFRTVWLGLIVPIAPIGNQPITNDTPASYTYQTMTTNLTDAFVEAGKGWGKTYIGIFPSYRIDYILHSSKFEAFEYVTHQEKLSDHYAISCKLKTFKD